MTRVRVPKNVREEGYIDVVETKEHLVQIITRATAYTMVVLTPIDQERRPGKAPSTIIVKASIIQAVE